MPGPFVSSPNHKCCGVRWGASYFPMFCAHPVPCRVCGIWSSARLVLVLTSASGPLNRTTIPAGALWALQHPGSPWQLLSCGPQALGVGTAGLRGEERLGLFMGHQHGRMLGSREPRASFPESLSWGSVGPLGLKSESPEPSLRSEWFWSPRHLHALLQPRAVALLVVETVSHWEKVKFSSMT